MVFTKINEKQYKITISPELEAELNYENDNIWNARWVLTCPKLFWIPVFLKPNGFVKEQAQQHIISACVKRSYDWLEETKSFRTSCPYSHTMSECTMLQMIMEKSKEYIINATNIMEEQIESVVVKIVEDNIDGCGSKAEVLIRIDLLIGECNSLTPQQAKEIMQKKLETIKKNSIALDQCLDTDDMITKAIQEMESEYPVDITVIYPYEVTF